MTTPSAPPTGPPAPGEPAGDLRRVAQWAAGSVSAEHATRLWSLLPTTVRGLVESGPDLLGTFLPETGFLARAEAHPAMAGGQLADLRRLVLSEGKVRPLRQADLFGQYVRVLRSVAREKPLLLVVDDLQWADAGSLGLLFELGKKIAGSPILILGMYRTTEVALGRDGARHPLEPVVNELAAVFGKVTVEFSAKADRAFVDALIGTEPNALGPAFRDSLFRQTQGHALFTVELLRDLEQQGFLTRDAENRRVQGDTEIDWNRLPARVDAVIAERIGRLAPELQRLLSVAAVEGERFTLEAVARIQGVEPHELLAVVNLELEKRHQLVSAEGLARVNGQRLSTYRFRHILFQRHLYDTLNEVERPYLHERIGEALEELHGECKSEIALPLARHFQEAGLAERAAFYLYMAGKQAEASSAPSEALVHFESARDILLTLPPSKERDDRELDLQLALAMTGLGVGAPITVEASSRAVELAEQMGTPAQLFWALSSVFWIRGHYGGDFELGR
ncbi:MAG: hypothetical protein MUO50_03905, partial [Longimicrobiales bacterium]|nr:hypothetical protein [Longimicrobiales bacterium]